MSKILNILSSMGVASVLLFIFAAAAAVATFIENDYGTPTAKALVYNAKWFEAIMVLLSISLLFNIFKQKLYTKEKIGSFLMHSSFIIILVGAGLTRYFGYEGVMHIREGESQSSMLSADSYIKITTAKAGATAQTAEEKVLFATGVESSFDKTVEFGGKSYSVKLKEFIPNAVKELQEVKGGKPMLSLVIAAEGDSPSQKLIEQNSPAKIGGAEFNIASDSKAPEGDASSVKFFVKDSKIHFISNKDIEFMKMSDRESGTYPKNEPAELEKGKLYNIEGVSFVPRYITASGALKISSSPSKMKGQSLDSALVFEISDGKEKKELSVMGQPQALGEEASAFFADTNVSVSYGAKLIKLPLSVKLNDFILTRYPGSMSPSSYESATTVTQDGKSYDYRIYMNHTLDANGYRFFQSSYDQDEKGTILSVSKDPGKIPTYLGYLVMAIGMGMLLIGKNSRFSKLSKTLEAQKAAVIAAIVFALSFVGAPLLAEDSPQAILAKAKSVDKELSKEFGKLLTQDAQGRVKPINTLAVDILDKVSGSSEFDSLSADETLFAMLLEPKSWQMIKLIKVSHPEAKKLLGLQESDKKAAFSDFFEAGAEGAYKLGALLEEANRKKPSERGTLDKEIIKLDERLNICYMVYSGKLIRVFPAPNDPNNTWLDPASAVMSLDANKSAQIRAIMASLLTNSSEALKDPAKKALAMQDIAKIKALQETDGKNVLPPPSKIELELLYNKLNIFKNLILVYLAVGFALLVSEFLSLSSGSKVVKTISAVSLAILAISFVLHTLNLGARWYISGHAPWSDGYESMTYIAWATTLAGILFAKKSSITLALTSILAGVALFVAHLSWMDPQITNIVPVLKSYWLTIHVSMITASYGFLGLGALIGFFSLVLFMVRSESKPLVDRKIRELAVINEMTLIVGLFMLTVGNFLGGVWANESWGRYWGWDPKETWAFVSIIVYTIVIHSKYIPKLSSIYALSVLSMFSFWSIIMTYFGVNFYLSGLHSYAQGDPVPVPGFVYITAAVMAFVAIAAYAKRDVKLV